MSTMKKQIVISALFILTIFLPLLLTGQEKELIIRQGHREMINMVKYSANGQNIYTAGDDHVIKMWDVNTGIDVKSFTGHQVGVKCIELSKDGSTMISGDAGGTILIWDLSGDPVPSGKIKAHSDAINVIQYMPDQKSFLSGSSDKLIKQWDSNDYTPIKTIEGMTGQVKSFGISPDGKRVVMGTQRANDVELLLINVETGTILDDALKHLRGSGAAKVYTAVILAPMALITSVGKGDIDKNMMDFYVFDYSNIEFTKDGKSVLISQNLYLPMTAAKGEEDKTGGTSVSLVELNDDQTMFKNVKGMKRWNIDYPKSRAVFNEDQTKIIVNIKHSINIYDIENAEFPTDNKEANAYEPPLLKKFTGNISWLNSIAISPDYRTVVSSGEDRSLDLWDIQSGRRIRRLKGYVQPALAVEAMPDGKHILIGSLHKNMAMWDITTGRLVRSFARSYDVNHIDISDDGKYLVTTAVDTRFFKLWNVRTGNILGTYMEKNDNIVWVKFDEDPKYILAETADGTLKKWSKDEKKIKKTLKESYSDYDDRLTSGSTQIKLSETNLSVNISGESVINDKQLGNITDAVFSIKGDLVFTTNTMGELTIYNVQQKKKIISMALIDDFDFITYTPDYYYTSSKGAANALAFREGEEIIPFEQMEILYNRPDIVAERLGGSSDKLIASYKKAYDKRMKRLGYSEGVVENIVLPKVDIDASKYPLATTESSFGYDVSASDPNTNLDRLNIYVNDVPVNGFSGIDISTESSRSVQKHVNIDLSAGLNEIKTVAVNERGIESIPHVMEINYEAPYRKPDLYIASIGVSKYENEAYNLSFAAKDATEVAAFFAHTDIYGHVYPQVLTDEKATSENVKNLVNFLSRAKTDDIVIVFIAGHGVLDKDYNYFFATYNMDFSNPSDGGMPYEDLEGLIVNLSCRNKLLFMDTCHSGELDTDEVEEVKTNAKRSGKVAFRSGGGIIQYKEDAFGLGNTLELSKTLFGDLKKGTGATVISAAGGTEFALEGIDSQNGLFTYSLMEGIKTRRADLNRDRKYTVSEIRTYIADRVVNLSRGQQVPTSREENLKYDFRIY